MTDREFPIVKVVIEIKSNKDRTEGLKVTLLDSNREEVGGWTLNGVHDTYTLLATSKKGDCYLRNLDAADTPNKCYPFQIVAFPTASTGSTWLRKS